MSHFSTLRTKISNVAVLEGEYDLGWSRNADGSFDLIADLWGVAKKHNQTELINSINQKYAVNQTLSDVKQRGLQNANVKLVLKYSQMLHEMANKKD